MAHKCKLRLGRSPALPGFRRALSLSLRPPILRVAFRPKAFPESRSDDRLNKMSNVPGSKAAPVPTHNIPGRRLSIPQELISFPRRSLHLPEPHQILEREHPYY